MSTSDMEYDSEDAEAEGDPDHGDEAQVECPHCGEGVELTLDPAGGAVQEYVEDCPVCCRPWQVHVSYDVRGSVEVRLEQDS